MEGDFGNFIKVWTSAFVRIFYWFSIGKIVPKGATRFLCVLPVVCLFLYLPLNFSSVYLGGSTGFFISWLGTFKLLLFAFGKGSLALDPSISIGRFLAIACLPIEIQENQPPKPQNSQIQTNPFPSKSHLNSQNRENLPPKSQKSPPKPQANDQNGINPSTRNTTENQKFPLNHVIKGLLLAILIGVLYYSHHIHPNLLLLLHCLYVYLFLETQLTIVAALAWGLLGFKLKPHFNEPYLSTSLQNFWGRRWNLVVTSILRSALYEPTLNFSASVIGRKWAALPAVFGSFLVSGLMQELIYFYMGRVRPTWEVTWFFVLHGVCVTVEIVLNKALKGRWRLPSMISVVLTVGFVVTTCFWLFFPQLLRFRADVKMLEEYQAFAVFVKNAGQCFR